MTLRPEQIVIDKAGWPAVHLKPPAAVALAAPAAPAPLPDRREILTLLQVAQLLSVDAGEASRLLTLTSLPRVVGWDAKAAHALAHDLVSNASLRKQLGVPLIREKSA